MRNSLFLALLGLGLALALPFGSGAAAYAQAPPASPTRAPRAPTSAAGSVLPPTPSPTSTPAVRAVSVPGALGEGLPHPLGGNVPLPTSTATPAPLPQVLDAPRTHPPVPQTRDAPGEHMLTLRPDGSGTWFIFQDHTGFPWPWDSGLCAQGTGRPHELLVGYNNSEDCSSAFETAVWFDLDWLTNIPHKLIERAELWYDEALQERNVSVFNCATRLSPVTADWPRQPAGPDPALLPVDDALTVPAGPPIDVTAQVTRWIAYPGSNYGWAIRGDDESLQDNDRACIATLTNVHLVLRYNVLQ
jgi:hypothetical protein